LNNTDSILTYIFGAGIGGVGLIGAAFKVINLMRKDAASVTGVTSDSSRIKELQAENNDLRGKLNTAWEVNSKLVQDKSDLNSRITKLESKLDQCLMILKALAEEHAHSISPAMQSMLKQVVDDEPV
jgi:chromosome segregation ATPase